MVKNKINFSKRTKIFLTIFAVLLICTVVGFSLLIKVPAMKYVLLTLNLLWTAGLSAYKILDYKSIQQELEQKMPAWLAELYNNGVITKEQCLNPTKQERKMFFAENARYLRATKFYIAMILFLGLFIFIYFI